jgi:hypothetical protein
MNSIPDEIRERAKRRDEMKERRKAIKIARREHQRAAMRYRATINIDYTNHNSTGYQKLVTALMQSGWTYIETSALQISSNLPTILRSLELIAKQCEHGGVLSALTLHIQGSLNFAGVEYTGAKNHPYALDEIRAKPWPQ